MLSRLEGRVGDDRTIGNVRFFTMGTCFFAATILKGRRKIRQYVGADGLRERRRRRLTLAVLQGLAGRWRVVDSERSQSRKLHSGADEWAVHTSALWGTLATVVLLMSS